MIRNNENIKEIILSNIEHKLGQFADDTEIYLNGLERSLQAAIDNLNAFYKLSGLKINIDKTKVLWLGSMAGSDIKLCGNIKLDWHKGNFEVLGIILNTGPVGNKY